MGSSDFKSGIESKLIIFSKTVRETLVYKCLLVISYKTPSHIITKNYKLLIKNISQLNELNCLAVQFSDSKSLKETFKLSWLGIPIIEVDIMRSFKMLDQSSFTPLVLNEYGVKQSALTGSNAFGLFGDLNRSSYFSVRNFAIKNFYTPINEIEYNFKSKNPNVFEFDALDSLNLLNTPQLVDTVYGKSLLFSRYDQRFTLKNKSNTCFGNLDLCKNGYALKIWTCFTNYNLMRITQNRAGYNNLFNSTRNMMKKMYLLQNGHKNSRKGLVIYYDAVKSQLVTVAKTSEKWFKSEVNFKLKLYAWYILIILLA